MSNNINYLLFRRSAVQFIEDLEGISREIDSLDGQEDLGVHAYSGDIKERIEYIRKKLTSVREKIEEKGDC